MYDDKFFELTIKGTYCANTLRLPIEGVTPKAFSVATQGWHNLASQKCAVEKSLHPP